MATQRPKRGPKPDLVSVCTSPDFVHSSLLMQLTQVLAEYKGCKL